VRSYLRSLNPQLPHDVWLLQVGGLANSFGNGLVLPFLIIYLHNVRGISLGVAGLAAASNSVAALCSGFLAGSLSDRIGARRVLIGALVVMACAISLFPFIRTAWDALALQFLLGSGSGAFWPSQSAMLTGLAPQRARHSAFAVQRLTMNLGIALGGFAGGLIASTAHPDTFTALFLLDAATFLAFALVLTQLRTPTLHRHEELTGYREVVRDRPFMQYIALNALFITVGMVVIVELLPPYAKNFAGVDEQQIGLLWMINSLVIVLAQLPIAKLAEGRRRMGALVVMAAIWAGAMVLIGIAGTWTYGTTAFLLMGLAVLGFGIGECLHGIVHGPLIADLAPPALVGRYMALGTQSWQVGWIVGPAVGGFVLQHAPNALWPACAVLNVLGAVGALALERRLPQSVRRAPRVIPGGTAGTMSNMPVMTIDDPLSPDAEPASHPSAPALARRRRGSAG
jgi:MFS family permease